MCAEWMRVYTLCYKHDLALKQLYVYKDACDPTCPASCLLLYTCIVLAGVAVATAFCAIESLAVTLPTEWPFGVNDTGSCYVPNLSAL